MNIIRDYLDRRRAHREMWGWVATLQRLNTEARAERELTAVKDEIARSES